MPSTVEPDSSNCEKLIDDSFVCTGTCNKSNKTLYIKKEEGDLVAVVVNDALSFNKNLKDIVFIDFGLVYKQ